MTTDWGALAGRVTAFVRLTLLTVVLPGVVLLVELWIVAGHPARPDYLTLPFAAAVGLVLYFGYVLGFASRDVSFRVAERLEPWLRRLRREPAMDARGWHQFCSRAALVENLSVLEATFGKEHVTAALRDHPLGLLAGDGSEPDHADYRDIFHYCKTYLRLRAPRLGTDSIELEINSHFAAVPPVVLAPVALWRNGAGGGWILVAAAAALALTAVLYVRGNEIRHAEVRVILRNLVFAHWMEGPGEPAVTPGAGPRTPSAQGDPR